MSDLRIALLGPPRVELEGERLDVDGRKPLALLAYLAVCGPQSRETLAALLWPHSDHERARGALRKALSLLNAVLSDRWLVRGRGEVGLDDEQVWTDVAAFREALGRADAHDHPATASCGGCLDELAQATQLYRDDFLAGFGLRDSAAFDDWQRQSADELRHELTVALDRLVEAHTHRGEFDVALTHANRRLAVEPLHEPTHRRLVLLHAWSGRRREAARHYERCAELLERELGVAPMPETVAAYDAVLAGHAEPPYPAAIAAAASPPVPGRVRTSLVGRAEEVRQALGAHGDAASGGHLLAVEGEAGAGKTALLGEVTRLLADGGAATVTIRGRAAERTLPYGAVADAIRQIAAAPGPGLAAVPAAWIAEAARLAPELLEAHPGLEPAPAVDAPETRRRLLEGIRRVLLGGVSGPVPGLVLIDDTQWLDEASLDAVLYVADRLTGPACLLVLAWRSEAVPADHRLRRLTADLAARGQADQLHLRPLARDDVAALVAADGHDDPDGAITDRLLQETQGLALLVVECLRVLPPGPVDVASWRVPTGARGLLQDRIDDLSRSARQVACVAAVLGRSFGLDVLLPASGMSETETISAVDELVEAGILGEDAGTAASAAPTYDFRFHALRTLVYEDISLARRRLLHRRVADALAAISQPSAPALAVVAQHLRLAGRDLEAAEAYVRAAEAGERVAALDEAATHLRSAIELGHPEPARLQERLGGLEKLRGDYPAALRALRSAASELHEPADQVRLELAIAHIHERRGAWHAAKRHLEQGLESVQQTQNSDAIAARLYAELALTAHRQHDPEIARARGREALERAGRSQDAWATALAHNTLGVIARAEGAHDEAVEHLEHAQLLAEEFEDPAATVAALNNLALTHADRGDRPRALELAKTALARCRRRGDRHREAALLNNLADLLHAAGRHEEAQQHLAGAVTLFADVGQPDQLEPEIWKLVDW